MRGKFFLVISAIAVLTLSSAFLIYSHVYAPSSRVNGSQVVLYFADAEATRVVPESRNLSNDVTPEAIMNELIKGPKQSGLFPTLPTGTRLLSINVKGETAYVDFSREVKDNHIGGSAAELMLVYSVVGSLTELPQIVQVQFLLEGAIEESTWGHVDTSGPIGPDENFIAR